MRWLYHVIEEGTARGEPYAPESLAREGFVHCSYKDAVAESARLYFAPGAKLRVLRIDPRRVGARIEEAATPRGPMPHVFGAIPNDAVAAELAVDEVGRAPDVVTGTRFAFVGFAGMTLLDLVGMYDPIARVASMGVDPSATCAIVSADEARVFADAGARFEVTEVRPPLEPFDVVLVAGGFPARALRHEEAIARWLASFPANRVAASVCTGALLLGAAGRLTGRRATTHASALGLLAEHGATAVKARVVDEGTVVTAAGVTAALDIGLHLVRRFYGDAAARKIAAQMETPLGDPP